MLRNVCAVLTDSEDVLNRVVVYFLILLSHNWSALVVVNGYTNKCEQIY